jgi:hypothetical protein
MSPVYTFAMLRYVATRAALALVLSLVVLVAVMLPGAVVR